MKNHMIIALAIALSSTGCGPAAKTITPPYDVHSPDTVVAWCPRNKGCPDSRFHLNTAYLANDTRLTFDDKLLVYHGAYCTILEKRTVKDYLWNYINWTDGSTQQTHLGKVEVWSVECDNRYRRVNDGETEYIEGSYSTQGWTFPNAMVSIREWDKEYKTP